MGNMGNMDFIMEYKLIQQTPLIHFQHDNEGATLRASEVKPKLDSYIKKMYACVYTEKGVPDNWYIDKKKNLALNYKIRFKADVKTKVDIIPYNIFFANMGEDRKNNPIKMLLGDCTMTIICIIDTLRDEIDRILKCFFICHTFGFMQGKGFGGYLLDKCNPSRLEIKCTLKQFFQTQHIFYVKSDLNTFAKKIQNTYGKLVTSENKFDNIIKPFHSMMKSGINFNGHERSFLFQYFHKNYQFGNDKAFVKSKGIAPIVYKSTTAGKGEHATYYEQYKYIRALLGITESIEYIKALDASDKPVKDSRGIIKKEPIAIKNIDDIERFPSPIQYRIIGDTVYVFAKPIDDRIFGSVFMFSSALSSDTIAVPEINEFDIEHFLCDYIEHVNTDKNARHVARFHNITFREVE